MVFREKYIKEIRDFYDSDLIKIITGIRRCGKSIVLSQIEKEISKKSKNIISLDFEDLSISRKIDTADKLIEFAVKNKKKGKCYLFLDEIQNLTDWNLAIKTLRLKDFSIFITGSNSKLLSREFTKELSGRYVSFRIRPFVYREVEKYVKELKKKIDIYDYIVWGGFPKRLEFKDEKSQKLYINELNQTIILNDLMSRYNIKKYDLFKKIVDYVMISNSRIFSIRSIHRFLESEKISCSVNTIIKYMSYLEEAYIINKVERYSRKAKRKLEYYYKLYIEDVSLNSIRMIDGRYDVSHNFENAVYNELIYMGYDLKVYEGENFEVDFIASKNKKAYYIQVALSVADDKTYEREMRGFDILDNSIAKILITNDDFDFSTSTVKHIKFKDLVKLEDLV